MAVIRGSAFIHATRHGPVNLWTGPFWSVMLYKSLGSSFVALDVLADTTRFMAARTSSAPSCVAAG